jgi:hypothetical protein
MTDNEILERAEIRLKQITKIHRDYSTFTIGMQIAIAIAAVSIIAFIEILR